MTLQINNLEELRGFLQTTKVEIHNIDDLQELLLSIQAQSQSPETRQDELLALERRQQQRLKYQVQMDAVKVAKKGIQASEEIGILVPFAAFGIALGATFILYDLLALTAVGIAFMGIIWGSTALVALLAVILAMATNRKKVTGLLQFLQEHDDSPMSSPSSHNSFTNV